MGNLTLKNCSFDLIPLENDLLSLEDKSFQEDLIINKDNSILN